MVKNFAAQAVIAIENTRLLNELRESLQTLNKVAILVRERSPTATQYVQESRAAARNLRIEAQVVSERGAHDLDGIFVAVRGATALVVADDAEFTAHRDQIAMLALKHQLPTVSGLKEMVEAGGLMAYGASFGELYRRACRQSCPAADGLYRLLAIALVLSCRVGPGNFTPSPSQNRT